MRALAMALVLLSAGKRASVESFMARMGIEVSDPRFLTPAQANRVIEALKAWLARKETA